MPVRTQAELLSASASAVYGYNWRGPLSRALDVSERTVMRWMTGQKTVPAGVWLDVGALLTDHASTCEALAFDVVALAGSTLVEDTSTPE